MPAVDAACVATCGAPLMAAGGFRLAASSYLFQQSERSS